MIGSLLKRKYEVLPAFERNEALFLFFTIFSLVLISFYFMFIYFKDQSYIYFYTETVCAIILGISLVLLVKGLPQYSIGVIFVIYGNIFLLKCVVFPEFIISGSCPFSPEIYHAFQVIIILMVGYFCKKIRGLIVTIIIGFSVNILHIFFNYSDWIGRLIFSTAIFIALPSILSLYVFKSKQLLYKYYKSNLLKDREINHRIKNHFAILRSMLNLKSSCNEYGNKGLTTELQTILDSFISVYDMLLHSENVHIVKLYDYLSNLFKQYESSLPLSVNYVQEDKGIYITSDKIIHFGMIIAELIANSLKHADAEILNISLKIETSSSKLIFQYSDSGRKKQDLRQLHEPGFGQSIIKMINENTLEGKSEINYTNGFHFTAAIPKHAIIESA